jgi:hypothetical protein
MEQIIEQIIQYLDQAGDFLNQSFIFRGLKFVLAFYLIVMTIASILIIIRLVKFQYLKVLLYGQETPVTTGKMQKRWNKLEDRLDSPDPNQWKAAVLEAATMLSEILGIIGYEGKTLGERLSQLQPAQLENLEQVKEANQIKNKIVQDSHFNLSKEDAERVVEVFGEALEFYEAVNLG